METIENLMLLVNDLRRTALLQHTAINEEVGALNERYLAHEQDGQRRLQVMQAEIQTALCELEMSYYSSRYR